MISPLYHTPHGHRTGLCDGARSPGTIRGRHVFSEDPKKPMGVTMVNE